uniref:Uncharacterized protein n=1 Tax=Opuntia streptacantha TaxID=393608 RepID=A0A7C9D412_OPUST
MAFKKTLVQRLFNLSRFSTPNVSKKPPIPDPARASDLAKMRRIQQRRPLYNQSAAVPAGFRLFPAAAGENLAEKLRGMDIARDRISLGGLIMPLPEKKKTAAREPHAPGSMSVNEMRKVVRAAQVEMIRAKLREIPEDWISYAEFAGICKECCGGNSEQAFSFAKMLDDSGSVIILGNAVCLRPHQEVKTLVRKI